MFVYLHIIKLHFDEHDKEVGAQDQIRT